MSANAQEDLDKVQCCASCGTGGDDDIKLKDCSACHLVRYCSVKCQRDHWSKHKKECKKRAAELKDEILFQQPESSQRGDCPICCLPQPIEPKKSGLMYCCSKRICSGCNYANQMREAEGRLQNKCPFCRKALPKTQEEMNEQLMERIEANDPVALSHLGTKKGNEGDYKSAFEYLTKAAGLGDVEAHYELSFLYRYGQGVEKDEKKYLYHLTAAAIGGDPFARYNLGLMEWENGKADRAVKHFIIGAKLGEDKALESVKRLYKTGLVSKDDFTAALRGHHAAIVATKSPQREEAYVFFARLATEGDWRGVNYTSS